MILGDSVNGVAFRHDVESLSFSKRSHYGGPVMKLQLNDAELASCVGCGLCGEVAHAAVLCPSFYRAEIISNPSGWDRLRQRFEGVVIAFLQRRVERRIAGITA